MKRDEQGLPIGVFVLVAITIAVGAAVAVAGFGLGGWSHNVQATHVTPEFLEGASNLGKTCADLQGEGQT